MSHTFFNRGEICLWIYSPGKLPKTLRHLSFSWRDAGMK